MTALNIRSKDRSVQRIIIIVSINFIDWNAAAKRARCSGRGSTKLASHSSIFFDAAMIGLDCQNGEEDRAAVVSHWVAATAWLPRDRSEAAASERYRGGRDRAVSIGSKLVHRPRRSTPVPASADGQRGD